MTAVYHPIHALFTDEADTRKELERVFNVCHGCRQCVNLCPTFPTLFSYIDVHEDHDAGRMTPTQQNHVVSECFHCNKCSVQCPYIPDKHELALDFPRLMVRARAMQWNNEQISMRKKVATALLGHTDLVGGLATKFSAISAVIFSAQPNSLVRRLLRLMAGISSNMYIAPFAKQRFSVWFAHRQHRITNVVKQVAVFPTCLVEYQNPDIGKDLIHVFEHNGIECSIAHTTKCCGAPFLTAGDIASFVKVATSNVASLAHDVRSGKDIVVPQSTCCYVLTNEYTTYVGGPDAELVAAHTFGASEYLSKFHESENFSLDTNFVGFIPHTVTAHVPQQLSSVSSLLALVGSTVHTVELCSGSSALWAMHAHNEKSGSALAEALGTAITECDSEVVVSECHLSGVAIAGQTGAQPVHPVQVVARAYGFAPYE